MIRNRSMEMPPIQRGSSSSEKLTRPKIGLALGSGIARGWAHIGIIKVLEEAGYRPQILSGSSIGALAGGCYAAGKIDVLEEFAKTLTPRKMFRLMDVRLGGSGLIQGAKLAAVLREHLEEIKIETLDMQFIAVATELRTGHEIWLREGDLVRAMTASYALPGIFRPIRYDHRWLIDGALVNPVPTSVCRAFGARLVIAVNLNRDAFGKSSTSANLKGENDDKDAERISRSLISMGQKTWMQHLFGSRAGPGITTVMMAALNIVQDRLARSRLAGDPPDIQISPKCGHIGLMDFEKAEEAIEAGAEEARRMLPAIEEAMELLSYR